jgi:uncharacterized membrane protein YcaP (DUF421 family)
VVSVITLLLLVNLTERICSLRRLLNEGPIVLLKNVKLHKALMRKPMVDEEDLDEIST